MVTALVAIAVMGQGAAKQSPASYVSKMLARYYGLSSLTGTMHCSQTALGMSLDSETIIQYQMPNLLYIKQSMGGPEPAMSRIVSNGNRFLYSIPQDTKATLFAMGPDSLGSELVENVVQNQDGAQKTMSVGDIYVVGEGGLPLHPAPPLNIAINRKPDLKAFADQLATVEDQGTVQIDGHQAHLIGGDWRQYAVAPVSGTYQLAINEDGDLLRYITKETVFDPRAPGMKPTEVTTTWTVNLTVNGAVNPNLFKDPALKPRG